METEKSIEHISTHDVVTDFGPFKLHTYRDLIENRLHLALMRGTAVPEAPFLVRVHVQNPPWPRSMQPEAVSSWFWEAIGTTRKSCARSSRNRRPTSNVVVTTGVRVN
jgi:hypothetical protein